MNPFANPSDPFADHRSEEEKQKDLIAHDFHLQNQQQTLFRASLEAPGMLVRGSSLEEEKFRGLAVGSAMGSFDLSIPRLHSSTSAPFSKHGQDFSTSSFMQRPVKDAYSKDTDLSSALESLKINNGTPADVPELPEFYEKYSSFSTNENPTEVLRRVVQILNQDDSVDFDLKADRFKVKGVFYRLSHSVKFHVYIFHKRNLSKEEQQEGQYLVEVQRRCGDCMSFMAFYREFAEKMGNALKNPSRVFTPEDEPVDLDQETLDSLLQMAGCNMIDVATEGARALCQLARHSKNAQLMASNAAFLKVVKKLISSLDAECNRLGASLANKVTSLSADCRGAVVEQCLPVATKCLAETRSPETRRQLASTCSWLAVTHQADMLACSPLIRDVLKKFEHDADGRLVTSVEKALNFLTTAPATSS